MIGPGGRRRGGLNGDGAIDPNDLTLLLTVLYRDDAGGAADVNGDDCVTSTDVVALVQLLCGPIAGNACATSRVRAELAPD